MSRSRKISWSPLCKESARDVEEENRCDVDGVGVEGRRVMDMELEVGVGARRERTVSCCAMMVVLI